MTWQLGGDGFDFVHQSLCLAGNGRLGRRVVVGSALLILRDEDGEERR